MVCNCFFVVLSKNSLYTISWLSILVDPQNEMFIKMQILWTYWDDHCPWINVSYDLWFFTKSRKIDAHDFFMKPGYMYIQWLSNNIGVLWSTTSVLLYDLRVYFLAFSTYLYLICWHFLFVCRYVMTYHVIYFWVLYCIYLSVSII